MELLNLGPTFACEQIDRIPAPGRNKEGTTARAWPEVGKEVDDRCKKKKLPETLPETRPLKRRDCESPVDGYIRRPSVTRNSELCGASAPVPCPVAGST